MTFKEANENQNQAAFGLVCADSLCRHCAHSGECLYTDDSLRTDIDYYEDIIIITECNFFEEET